MSYYVLDDFRIFRKHLQILEEVESQSEGLKLLRIHAVAEHREENDFNRIIDDFLSSLQKLKALKLGSDLSRETRKKTKTVEAYTEFYRTALLEVRKLTRVDENYHARLLKDYRGLILEISALKSENARRVESRLWEMFFLHERVYHHRDITAFPELKRLEAEVGELTADRDFFKNLHLFVQAMEDNYFLWLKINDRISFLVETEDHFFDFITNLTEAITKLHHQRHYLMMKTGMFLVLCFILSTVFFWLLVSRYLARFLKSQHDAIQSIQNSEYDYHVTKTANDEFGELTIFMKKMAGRLQDFVGEISAARNRYQTLIDTTDTGYVILDRDGNVQEANENYIRMTGYQSFEEIRGRNVREWTASHDLERMEEERESFLRRGYVKDLGVDYCDSRGNITPVEISASVIVSQDDVLILFLCRDVTVRKKFEDELSSEKERLAVTLRSIGDGVITTDKEGAVTLINKTASDLTGWEMDEAIGKPLGEVFNIISEKTGERCENPVEKVLKSGSIAYLANHTALISKEGSIRSIADSGAPIRDRLSEIIGVVLVFRDITEQNKTEQKLLKVQKLESVGVLAGGIAHDFNNILTAILGNVNLALFDSNLNEKTKKILEQAEKASLRARDLTQQLLTFAKGGEPVKEVSSLGSVIRDSAEFVMHGHSSVCHYDIPDDLWLADIDKGQISQVIQNIVLNAAHAMPEGGEIHITCENFDSADQYTPDFFTEERYVKISIRDSGVGIPANVAEKIFDPYFSTKQEGSGLGLAIAQSILAKHQGHIMVESSPGNGSVFLVYLPATGETVIPRSVMTEEEFETGHAKILVMDDEELVRIVATGMLHQLGHEVVAVADGEEAVKEYRESMMSGKPFDVVIMDLTIPGGMGGKDTVLEILKIDSAAKVVVSSGYSNDPIMAKYREYGFCSAVVKPYRLQELSEIIHSLLG